MILKNESVNLFNQKMTNEQVGSITENEDFLE